MIKYFARIMPHKRIIKTGVNSRGNVFTVYSDGSYRYVNSDGYYYNNSDGKKFISPHLQMH